MRWDYNRFRFNVIIFYRVWCDCAIVELCHGDYVHFVIVGSWNTTMPQRKSHQEKGSDDVWETLKKTLILEEDEVDD